ncbi:hypothetical protein [Paraburkholderia sp. GAS199]|uniref:hypothetical protein n=1 Tax=Paraburkholderia sp. GAS199 TaxID=3035126 RepID=UPI003D22CEE7
MTRVTMPRVTMSGVSGVIAVRVAGMSMGAMVMRAAGVIVRGVAAFVLVVMRHQELR